MASFNLGKNALTTMIATKDENSIITSCNDIFVYYGGVIEDKAIGQTDYNLPWAKYADLYRSQEVDALEGNPYSTIIPIQDSHGDEHIFLHTKLRKLNKKGKTVGLDCYASRIESSNVCELVQLLNQGPSTKMPCYYIGNRAKTIKFTIRQKEILFYLTRGKTAKDIARILGISYKTVECHLMHIKEKIGVHTKSQVIDFAVTNGFANFLPELRPLKHIIGGLKL